MCGGPGMDMKISSTIGYERATTRRSRSTDEDGSSRRRSPASGRSRRTSRRSSSSTAARCSPTASRCCRSRRARSSTSAPPGALLVDVRTDQQFDDAHIPGAVCNPMLRAGFGSKLAWLGRPRAARSCSSGATTTTAAAPRGSPLSVGLRRLGGFLHGGMTSWRQEQRPIECVERLPLEDAAEPRRRRADPRRARGDRVGRGPHPRLGLPALARHRRRCPRGSTRSGRSRSCAPRASARRRRRACPAPRRRATCSTWSTAASPSGAARSPARVVARAASGANVKGGWVGLGFEPSFCALAPPGRVEGAETRP